MRLPGRTTTLYEVWSDVSEWIEKEGKLSWRERNIATIFAATSSSSILYDLSITTFMYVFGEIRSSFSIQFSVFVRETLVREKSQQQSITIVDWSKFLHSCYLWYSELVLVVLRARRKICSSGARYIVCQFLFYAKFDSIRAYWKIREKKRTKIDNPKGLECKDFKSSGIQMIHTKNIEDPTEEELKFKVEIE